MVHLGRSETQALIEKAFLFLVFISENAAGSGSTSRPVQLRCTSKKRLWLLYSPSPALTSTKNPLVCHEAHRVTPDLVTS